MSWWTWGGSNSRPHGCKAYTRHLAYICCRLRKPSNRCYVIDGLHLLASLETSNHCVVVLTFAPVCPVSMPAEGKIWAMFRRPILAPRRDICSPAGYRDCGRSAPLENTCGKRAGAQRSVQPVEMRLKTCTNSRALYQPHTESAATAWPTN